MLDDIRGIKLTTTNSAKPPIVLYMTGLPYSAYTNYSWTSVDGFKDRQFNEMFVKSFNVLTQGNKTLDNEWTTYLNYAVINSNLENSRIKRIK
jgi:hypothetical protein